MATPGHAATASRAEKEYRRALKRLRREIRRLTKIAEDNRDFSRAGRVFSLDHLVNEAKATMEALGVFRPDAIRAARTHIKARETTVAEFVNGDEYQSAVRCAVPTIEFLLLFDWSSRITGRLIGKLRTEYSRPDPPDILRLANAKSWLSSLLKPAPTRDRPWYANGFSLWSPWFVSRISPWESVTATICNEAAQFESVDDLLMTFWICDGLPLKGPAYCDAFLRPIENAFNWLDDWIDEHPLPESPEAASSKGASPLIQVEIDVLTALREAHPSAMFIQDVAERAGYAKNRKLVSTTLSGLANRAVPLTVRRSLRKGYGLTGAGVVAVDDLIKRATAP